MANNSADKGEVNPPAGENNISKNRIFLLGADKIESLLPYADFAPGSGSLESALSRISNLLGHGSIKRGLEELFSRIITANARRGITCSVHDDSLTILCNIRRWALEGLHDDDLLTTLGEGPLLAPDPAAQMKMMTKASKSVTAKQARCIIANAFIGNCNDAMESQKDIWNAGGLDFRGMLRGLGISKMECLLTYFDVCASLEGTEDDERVISFDLIQFLPLSAASVNQVVESRNNTCTGFVGDGMVLHTGTMESPTRKTSAFVNFANPNYGYGKFTRSSTQEEILLMCCPELIVGMLFIGKMKDNEVVNVHGVRRYCKYSGYLQSFRCEGPVLSAMEDEGQSSITTTVLTLDACYQGHFSEVMLWRDVSKACYSFIDLTIANKDGSSEQQCKEDGPCSRPIVSTGKWGCGAFGGAPAHKMLQQAVAAAIAGVELEFSSFGSHEGCDVVVEALRETKPSIAKVISLLQCCKDQKTFVNDAVCFLRKDNGRQDEGSGGLADVCSFV